MADAITRARAASLLDSLFSYIRRALKARGTISPRTPRSSTPFCATPPAGVKHTAHQAPRAYAQRADAKLPEAARRLDLRPRADGSSLSDALMIVSPAAAQYFAAGTLKALLRAIGLPPRPPRRRYFERHALKCHGSHHLLKCENSVMASAPTPPSDMCRSPAPHAPA